MTPTWYDVLGVDESASTEEIRAAWKAGIADLDPGDRRFRSLSEAAEVLLDPTRRAAYDATLAPEPEVLPAPVPDPVPLGDEVDEVHEVHEVHEVDEEEDEDAALPPTTEPTADSTARPRRGVPAWVLAVLAVLTVLMVVAAAYLATQPSDDAIAESTSEAQATAERSAVTILSYDYREMDQDQEAAGALMTSDYREKYDDLFNQLKPNAPTLKVVVTCDVVASGIVRSGEDRVQVLVFVNRPTQRADLETPRTYRDQVRITMVRSGDDWLVDDMETSPTAA